MKIITSIFFSLCGLMTFLQPALAQEFDPALDSVEGGAPFLQTETQYAPDQFMRARVLEVVKNDYISLGNFQQPYQELSILVLEGEDAGATLTVEYGMGATLQENQRLKEGDSIILGKVEDANGITFYVVDSYRTKSVLWMAGIFVALILLFGRKRGLTSIIGLIFTLGVLVYGMIPQIVAGRDPLMVVIGGALIICVISLYLAHGFNRQTSIAVASTLATLALSIGFSWIAVWWARLSGQGTEEAFFLQFGNLEHISLSGLLLAGIIIGSLGVLDDITTAQSAVVFELKHANPSFGWMDLYKRAVNVGREHIASLVNTLVLAYAGASFPLLLLFSMEQHMPWWVIINGESIMEEIVRTLCGSIALVLAVPITTLIASWYWKDKTISEYVSQSHRH